MFDPDMITKDQAIQAGQFWYVATRAWWMANMGNLPDRYSYLAEVKIDLWIPAAREEDWLMERQLTGRRIWVQGSEEQAAEAGFEIKDPWPTGRWRAPHGDFWAAESGREPAPREGSWQQPTPDFAASLPRNASRLLARLREDSPSRRGDIGVFSYARDALRSGNLPADLRGALYKALLLIPGSAIAAATPQGRQEFSLSLDDGSVRSEIFINGEDGQFAGDRSTFTRDIGEYRAGTVRSSSEVTTNVVREIGAKLSELDL